MRTQKKLHARFAAAQEVGSILREHCSDTELDPSPICATWQTNFAAEGRGINPGR